MSNPKIKETFYAIWFIENPPPTIALTEQFQAALFLKRTIAVKKSKELSARLGLKTKVVTVTVSKT